MTASKEFLKTYSKKSLRNIYYTSIKYKSAIGIDLINNKVFEKNLEKNIDIINKKTLQGTYKFSQYREKLLLRGSKRYPRVISIPTMRDKLTLKALNQVLTNVFFEQIPQLHKIVFDVNYSKKNEAFTGVIRLDIEDFYPSIKHDLLIQIISKKIHKKEILQLIKNAISQKTVCKGEGNKKSINGTGIPQGLPISNILANVYMSIIDKKYSTKEEIKFFRYVDDILIFCNIENIPFIKQELFDDCSYLGLIFHTKDDSAKCFEGDKNSDFCYLGYSFSQALVSVDKGKIENLRDSLISIFTAFKYSGNINRFLWKLNLRITGCQFNNKKYGWLFYYSQINDLQALAELDHFILKKIETFKIEINGNKIKKFIRSFHEITKNLSNTKYIPNFDDFDLVEKKNTLQEVFQLSDVKDEDVERLFRKKIFQSIKELEKDISRPS